MPDYGGPSGFGGGSSSGGGRGGFDGLGDSRDQLGSGTIGKDFSGPQNEQEVNANEKINAMSVTTPTTFALDPMTATAMFGNQLGPQLAGMDVFRSQKSAETLAARLNIGQLGMMASKISNPVVRALAMGPISIALNELGKFSAKNVINEIISGANPVYDSAGNITGASTDERGLIAGYDANRLAPDADGSKESVGTFTAPSQAEDEAPTPTATSGSMSVASSSYKAKGPQDSSGSGRRSLFGRKV